MLTDISAPISILNPRAILFVTEATIKSGGAYGLAEITIKAVVKDIDCSVSDNKMKVYFKYIIKDSAGNEVQKGTATPVTYGKIKWVTR